MKLKKLAFFSMAAPLLMSGCFGSGGNNNIPEIKGEPLEVYLKEGLVGSYVSGNPENQTITDSPESDAASDDASGDEYSDTNTQESGVDEADLVKQSGDYIYSAGYFVFGSDDSNAPQSGLKVYSVSTNPLASQLESSIPFTGSLMSEGLYLADDQLIVLTPAQSGTTVYPYETEGQYQTIEIEPVTEVRFMSLDDPAQPSETLKVGFTGDLLESRLIGDELYLVIRYWVSETRAFGPKIYDSELSTVITESLSEKEMAEMLNEAPLENFLPRFWRDGELSGHLFGDGLCHLPDAAQGGYPSIISVVRINIDSPDDWEAKCNSGRIHGVYASQNAFVLAGYDQENWDATRLDWYALDDFRLIATGSVPGTLAGTLPSFRLSEKDGYLRVLTSSSNFTVWESIPLDDVAEAVANDVIDTTPVVAGVTADHRLYTLRPNQNNGFDLISELPNLERQDVIGKPGESVRSVRYRDDRAYVVTFQRTDPLYVLNLSDPADPYIEGELEITGFSSYLHPLKDNLLLGLGYAANEQGWEQGLKVSLFDVSTPSDPQEVRSLVLGDAGSYSEAMNDNRASSYLQIDEHTTRLAFTWRHISEGYEYEGEKLFVADIDTANATLTERLNVRYDDEDFNYWSFGDYTRALLQNDGVHLVEDGDVISGDISVWGEK